MPTPAQVSNVQDPGSTPQSSGPVVMPPPDKAPPMQQPSMGYQPPSTSDPNQGSMAQQPSMSGSTSPQYDEDDLALAKAPPIAQNFASSSTTSFKPEAMDSPIARGMYEGQIQQDLEQNRIAGEADYRNAMLGLRQQSIQTRLGAQAFKDQESAKEDEFKSKNAQYHRDPNGQIVQDTDANGKPLFKAGPLPGMQVDPTTNKPYQDVIDAYGNKVGKQDPDAKAPIVPFTDSDGANYLVKQNKYSDPDYVKPEDAINGSDPRMQQNAAKMLHGAALTNFQSQYNQLKDSATDANQELIQKYGSPTLKPDDMAQLKAAATSDVTQDQQGNIIQNGVKIPAKSEAWFGMGTTDNPDYQKAKEALDAKSQAQQQLSDFQNRDNLFSQVKQTKNQADMLQKIGPAGFLQSYRQGAINLDGSPKTPDQPAAQKKSDPFESLIGDAQQDPDNAAALSKAGLINPDGSLTDAGKTYQQLYNQTQFVNNQVKPLVDTAAQKSDDISQQIVQDAKKYADQNFSFQSAAADSGYHPIFQSRQNMPGYMGWAQDKIDRAEKAVVQGIGNTVTSVGRITQNAALDGTDGIIGQFGKFLIDKGQAVEQNSNSLVTDPNRDKELSSSITAGLGGMLPMLSTAYFAPVEAALQFKEGGREAIKAQGGSNLAAETGSYGVGAIAGLSQFVLGPLGKAAKLIAPEASDTLAKAAVNWTLGSLKAGARNAAEMAVQATGSKLIENLGAKMGGGTYGNDEGKSLTRQALEASGIGDENSTADQAFQPLNWTGVLSNALTGAFLHQSEFAHTELNNLGVKSSVYAQGARSSYVAGMAKTFSDLDGNSQLTSDQRLAQKEALMHGLSPDVKTALLYHAQNAAATIKSLNDIQRSQHDQVPPAVNPALAKMSLEELTKEAAGQNPSSNHPDDPNPKFGVASQDEVLNEMARRAGIFNAQQTVKQQAAQFLDGITAQAKQGEAMVKTPDGRAILDNLNHFNLNRSSSDPIATVDTYQRASDISPQTDGASLMQPHADAYLPIAHSIEKLSPDDQHFATAALKAVSGRTLSTDEQHALVGSEDGLQHPRTDPVSGMPYATQDKTGIHLTDAGLDYLRNAVPESERMLSQNGAPVTAAYVAEQKAQGKKPTPLKPEPKAKQAAVEKKVLPQPEVKPTRVPRLMHVPDDEMQSRIQHLHAMDQPLAARGERLQAERAKIQESIGNNKSGASHDHLADMAAKHDQAIAHHQALTARHQVDVTDHEQEMAARKEQRRTPAERAHKLASTPEGTLKESGDPVDFTDDKGQKQSGEISDVLRGTNGEAIGYQVVDSKDQVHELPFDRIHEPEPKTEEPAQVAAEPTALTSGGNEKSNQPKPEQPIKPEHVPGVDPAISAKHPEASQVLNKATRIVAQTLHGMGMDVKNAFKAVNDKNGFGLSIADGDHIRVDMETLQKNLDALNQHSDKEKLAVVIGKLREEIVHIATIRANKEPGDSWAQAKQKTLDQAATMWKGLSKEAQAKVLETYGDQIDSDGNRGMEAVRMIVQLQREGKTAEMAVYATPGLKAMFHRILNSLKSLLKPGDKFAQDMISRVHSILDTFEKGPQENLTDADKPNKVKEDEHKDNALQMAIRADARSNEQAHGQEVSRTEGPITTASSSVKLERSAESVHNYLKNSLDKQHYKDTLEEFFKGYEDSEKALYDPSFSFEEKKKAYENKQDYLSNWQRMVGDYGSLYDLGHDRDKVLTHLDSELKAGRTGRLKTTSGSEKIVFLDKAQKQIHGFFTAEGLEHAGFERVHDSSTGADHLKIRTGYATNEEALSRKFDAMEQIPGIMPIEQIYGRSKQGSAMFSAPFLPENGDEHDIQQWEKDNPVAKLPASVLNPDMNHQGTNYMAIGKDGEAYLLSDVREDNFRREDDEVKPIKKASGATVTSRVRGKAYLTDPIVTKLKPEDIAAHPEFKAAYDQAMSKKATHSSSVNLDSRKTDKLRTEKESADLTGVAHASNVPSNFASKALGFVHPALQETAKDSLGLVHQASDDILKVWAPQQRSEGAAFTGRALSQRLAEAARENDVTQHAFEKASAFFDRQTPAFNHDVIAHIENNTKHPDPQVQGFIDALRSTNIKYRDMVRNMPNTHFKAFIENYFPHIFKQDQVDAVQKFFQKKIQGSIAFLKHRTIPTVQEALKAGFELESDNPVSSFLLRWNQMNKYMAGQKLLDDIKTAGLAVKYDKPEDAPLGWRQIDNRIGLSTELLAKGQEAFSRPDNKPQYKNVHYYAPDEVCRIIENHLSPGLRDNAAYKIATGIGNALNQAQLGLSAFHLGFTTGESAVSKLAYGLEQLVRGNIKDALPALGQSALNMSPVAVASIPYTAYHNIKMGDKMYKEWQNPGSQGGEIEDLVKAVIAGGGRAGMPHEFSNQAVKSFMKVLRGPESLWTKSPALALKALPAAMEAASKPILEYIVPRQKLAVFRDLARMEMSKLGPGASQDEGRKAMQRAWATVDNRLGEMVYDNLYWHKTAKDIAMLSCRSVGWNLGSWRELPGGVYDWAKLGAKAATGQKLDMSQDFTHKMAYTLALPLMAGAWGAMINYLYTGQWPQDMRDYFFPRTGETTPDGHQNRLSLPTYIKDVAGFAHQPGQTMINKFGPLWSTMAELWQNKDFYGTEIRHEDDNYLKQGAQVLGFGLKQFVPFAASGLEQERQQGAGLGSQIAPFFGFTPAPAWIDKSPAEEAASEINSQNAPSGSHTADQQAQREAKNQVYAQLEATDPKKGSPEELNERSAKFASILRDAVQNGIIPRNEVEQTIRRIRQTPLQRQFESMSYDNAVKVWKLATPDEKLQLRHQFQTKIDNERKRGQPVDASLLTLSQ